MKPLSENQMATLVNVAKAHARSGWYRASRSGERVTLASLYRGGWLERHVWRAGKSTADNAHEYRLGHDVLVAMQTPEMKTRTP